MRLIDADALEYLPLIASCGNGKYNTVKVLYERDIENAPTVDAVKATMPWTNPDGTETMLDEVSYEIGYSQGQKDTKRQGCKGCKHWIYRNNFGEDCEFDNLENCKYEPKDGR